MPDPREAAPPTLRCRCGATIAASGDRRLSVLRLRHGTDPGPLTLYADSLIRRLAAGDATVLGEAPIRVWLPRDHPAAGESPPGPGEGRGGRRSRGPSC